MYKAYSDWYHANFDQKGNPIPPNTKTFEEMVEEDRRAEAEEAGR